MSKCNKETVAGFLSRPVHKVTDILHHHIPLVRFPHSKKVVDITIGSLVMYVGALFAHHYHGPLFEAIGFAIHGLGLAPFVKILEAWWFPE